MESLIENEALNQSDTDNNNINRGTNSLKGVNWNFKNKIFLSFKDAQENFTGQKAYYDLIKGNVEFCLIYFAI